ncbi:hypothetical protein [Vibrio palustris]|uniref:Uncharacterized protein n=1 Tax=Vibrio palustris TaxID=1918946 RepID=A0A1R4B3K6_9VIBR|nr:hypothetical protein [Vibrio palustris]SJL83500.1 hypothetical protein VPAL9027_01468 [Vibrio palustris]
MFKPTVIALGLTAVLSGCSVTEVCPPTANVDLPKSSVPAKSSASVKVIVLPVEISYKDATASRMKAAMLNKLEGQVLATGTKLIDRHVAKKLNKEIRLAEKSGRYNNKGVPIADYAVITEINSSDLSRAFTKRRTYKDKDGDYHTIPASCSFRAEVTANAKVYALPSMKLVKRIELKGDESAKNETNNSRCPINQSSQNTMARTASERAVKYSMELQEMLAATAPVEAMRQCEKSGYMVRIGAGTNRNVQPKADVDFSQSIKNSRGEIETFTLGKGYIVNNKHDAVKPNYSWVSIDEELAQKIHAGDSATVHTGIQCALADIDCQLEKAKNKVKETAGL